MRDAAGPDLRPRRFLGAVMLAAALAGCEPTPGPSGDDLDAALARVSAERFRAHMAVLADDRMQGRETATKGYRMAADYVASRFAEFGLAPMGDEGSYFQQVPFLTTRLDTALATLELQSSDRALALVFGEDFVTFASFGASEESVTAPLVFVGYGVHAPQHSHDDFAGIEPGDSILVRFTGAPSGFPTDERAFYSSGWVKDGFAVERGAIGVITVRTPIDLPRLRWERYTSAIGSNDMRWADGDGRAFEAYTQLEAEAVLSEAGAAKLFALAGRDLDDLFARHDAGETGSFELGIQASMARGSIQGRRSSPNVIGMIPGSEAALDEEYLLYTAHLDHLGVRPGDSGEEIYNGAYDNAAGVATILEVASIMAANPAMTGRSVVFAALTGEEKGLQGSSYLAHNPPWPAGSLVAVINVDMPFLGFPIAEIMGLGAGHSSLRGAMVSAAEQGGLQYIDDPRPELVRFIRSDQFSFVRRGVPGLNLKPGARSADPTIDGPAMHGAFLSDHYHRPSDDLGLPYSPQGVERFARVALLLGLDVANARQRPKWNEGDFFGGRFAKDQGPD